MNENLKKIKNIFRSPALRAILQWSRPVHLSIILISAIAVISSLISLGVTLVTKSLIDRATSGKESEIIFGHLSGKMHFCQSKRTELVILPLKRTD